MTAILLRDAVEAYAHAGVELDDIDRELIQPAPLSEDEKAALWLLAWCSLPRDQPADRPKLARS
jgi:hypothetical protein